MQSDGVRRALAFTTSIFSSYSGCRQYLEDIQRARAEVGDGAPQVDKLRSFYNHPLFIEAEADRIRAALEERSAGAQIVYTAHSIPVAMAESSDYQAPLAQSCRLVSGSLGVENCPLVFKTLTGTPTH